MDQEKIGKLIADCRKNMKMTQVELANKLGVTYQAVSKWENGRGFPDIEMLKKISEIFCVDIDEILNGERKVKKEISNKKIFLICISIIIFLIISFVFICKVYLKNDIVVATINSIENKFLINGVLISEKNKTIIHISNIRIIDNIEKQFYGIEAILYEDNGDNYQIISKYGDIEKVQINKLYNLEELLRELSFDVDNYDDSCKNFQNHNLFIVLNAMSEDKNVISYKIPLSLDSRCIN